MWWNKVGHLGTAMIAASTLTVAASGSPLPERDVREVETEAARRCAETASEPQRLRVRIVPNNAFEEAVLAYARAEIEAIWRPYQVEITWEEHWSVEKGTPMPDLWIQFIDGTAPSKRGMAAIAWVPFANGVPMPYARVSRPAAMGLLATKSWFDGRPLRDLSPDIQRAALGRIVGRALAHEIGHFLTASPTHAKNGLMKASIDPGRLVYPTRDFFKLEAGAVRALRTARLASCELAAARYR